MNEPFSLVGPLLPSQTSPSKPSRSSKPLGFLPLERLQTPEDHIKMLWPVDQATGEHVGVKWLFYLADHHTNTGSSRAGQQIDPATASSSSISDEMAASSTSGMLDPRAHLTRGGAASARDHAQVKIKQAVAKLDGQPNRYVSVNTFSGRRGNANVHSLSGLFLDLDLKNIQRANPALYHQLKVGKRATGEVLQVLTETAIDLCNEQTIPLPNVTVQTGGGIHLYWLFDEPLTAKATPRWRACINQLMRHFNTLGADRGVRDPARVLRLVGTTNSRVQTKDPETGAPKSWKVTGQILSTARYSFDHLCQILPWSREQVKAHKQKKASKVREMGLARLARSGLGALEPVATAGLPKSLAGFMQVNAGRLVQLSKQAALLHPQGVPASLRNTYVYLASACIAFLARKETFDNEVLAWAHKFCPSFTQAEVASTISSVRSKAMHAYEQLDNLDELDGQFQEPRYKYKTKTWAALLGMELSRAVQQGGAEFALPSCDSINKQKLYTCQGFRHQNKAKVIQAQALRASGKTLEQIASELEVSAKTIHKWLQVEFEQISTKEVDPVSALALDTKTTSNPSFLPNSFIYGLPAAIQGGLRPVQAMGGSGGITPPVDNFLAQAEIQPSDRIQELEGEDVMPAPAPASVRSQLESEFKGKGKKREREFTQEHLAKLRSMHPSKVLEKLGLYNKPDTTYHPQVPDKQRYTVELKNGRVIELVFTGQRGRARVHLWTLDPLNIHGSNALDLASALLSQYQDEPEFVKLVRMLDGGQLSQSEREQLVGNRLSQTRLFSSA